MFHKHIAQLAIISFYPFFFAMVVPNYPSSSEALCGVSEYPCFYSVRLLETTPGRLSTTDYSIYSQLTSISGSLLPYLQPRARAMPCDRNPRMESSVRKILAFQRWKISGFIPVVVFVRINRNKILLEYVNICYSLLSRTQ